MQRIGKGFSTASEGYGNASLFTRAALEIETDPEYNSVRT